MSKPFKPKRGTTAQNNSYIGEAHEVTLDTEKHTLVVRDGTTAGGFPLARADEVAQKNAQQDAAIAGKLDTRGGTMTGLLTLAGTLALTSAEDVSTYITGGPNTNNSYIQILGRNFNSGPGRIMLIAKDAEGIFGSLYVHPDGKVTTKNGEVLTTAGGTTTGSLTSTSSPYNFIAKNSTIDSTVTPASNTYVGYEVRDKNDKRLAWAGYRKSVDGRDYYEVQVVGTNGNLTLYNDGELTTKKGTVLTLMASWNDGNGNWYRKYSDGWIEQGGHMPSSGTASIVVFNIPFTSTNYTLTLGEVMEVEDGDTDGFDYTTGVSSLTTTGFRASKASGRPIHWHACGY
jgi:hypothetical protein